MPRTAKLGATRSSYVFRVRVPDDLRVQWEEHCAKKDRKPAGTIRSLMRYMVQDIQPPAVKEWVAAQTTPETDQAAKERVEVRLTQSEYAAVKERAEAEGISLQRYVVNCVRASLTNEPQFTMEATKALWESAFQLRAVGRNLNQITRAINMGRELTATEKQLQGMADYIQRHTDKANAVLDASLYRWRVKRGGEGGNEE
jgi:predicted DNA binding CopG/RHH family protein